MSRGKLLPKVFCLCPGLLCYRLLLSVLPLCHQFTWGVLGREETHGGTFSKSLVTSSWRLVITVFGVLGGSSSHNMKEDKGISEWRGEQETVTLQVCTTTLLFLSLAGLTESSGCNGEHREKPWSVSLRPVAHQLDNHRELPHLPHL